VAASLNFRLGLAPYTATCLKLAEITKNQNERNARTDQSAQSCANNITNISLKTLANKVLSNLKPQSSNTTNTKLSEKLRSNLYVSSDITIKELQEFLGDDWSDYKDNLEALIAWVDLLMTNRLIEQGKIPPHFTAVTHCIHCGDVPVPPSQVNGGEVLSCIWCWNRTKNLPIPKISTTNNGDKK
jgi:hypothetical protein